MVGAGDESRCFVLSSVSPLVVYFEFEQFITRLGTPTVLLRVSSSTSRVKGQGSRVADR